MTFDGPIGNTQTYGNLLMPHRRAMQFEDLKLTASQRNTAHSPPSPALGQLNSARVRHQTG